MGGRLRGCPRCPARSSEQRFWLVEFVVRTPAAAIAIVVIAVLAFVGWVRSLNTPEAKRSRQETLPSARCATAGRAVVG